MARVNCASDGEWTAYLADNPAVWGQGHLRPAGVHTLPLFRAPPAEAAVLYAIAGPPGSGAAALLEELRRRRPELSERRPPREERRPDVTRETELLYRAQSLKHLGAGPASVLAEASPLDAWRFVAPDVIAGASAPWKREVLKAAGVGALTDLFSARPVVVFCLEGPPGPGRDEWRSFYFPRDGSPRGFRAVDLAGASLAEAADVVERALFPRIESRRAPFR